MTQATASEPFAGTLGHRQAICSASSQVAVLVALQLADELSAAGSQAGDDGVAAAPRATEPALGSVFGLGLLMDIQEASWDDTPLRARGIEPRTIETFLHALP